MAITSPGAGRPSGSAGASTPQVPAPQLPSPGGYQQPRVPQPAPQRTRGHRAGFAIPALPFAIFGTLLVVGGAVVQLIALVSSTWWHATVGTRQITLRFNGFAPLTNRGFAYMYFGWGAWLILGLTLALGVAGCVHWRGAHAFRITGALVGVAASIAPIAALLVFAYQSDTGVFQVVRNYGVGPYLIVLGTMATAFGAAAGGASTTR